MEYIRGGSPLPVPFNIIPAPHSALLLITGTCRRWRPWKRDSSAQTQRRTAATDAGGEEHSPIYMTRPNGTIAKATNNPAWQVKYQLECGPMPNVMVVLPNIGGVLCSTPQSLADAHY